MNAYMDKRQAQGVKYQDLMQKQGDEYQDLRAALKIRIQT